MQIKIAKLLERRINEKLEKKALNVQTLMKLSPKSLGRLAGRAGFDVSRATALKDVLDSGLTGLKGTQGQGPAGHIVRSLRSGLNTTTDSLITKAKQLQKRIAATRRERMLKQLEEGVKTQGPRTVNKRVAPIIPAGEPLPPTPLASAYDVRPVSDAQWQRALAARKNK